MKNFPTTGLVLAALALVATGVAVGAGLSRPTGGEAQQPGALQPGAVQYACLTLSELRDTAPEGNGRWEFQDSTGRYDANAMSKAFGVRANEANRAMVVTMVAAKGWELVSHTDSTAYQTPRMQDGHAVESKIRRAEQWWFRKR